MAQSNISGPFNITNGLIVGGTAHITGALTLDAGQSSGGNLTAGTSLIWASGTAGKWTGVVTTGNVQSGTAVIWPSGTATTWTGLTTTGNLSAGTSVIWPSGTATTWTGLETTGNLTAGTGLIWASGTAGKWTGVVTSGNVTAGTSLIWPNGTATTTGLAVRGAISATTTLAVTGNSTLSGTITAGTARLLFGTYPVTDVVNASFWGDVLFNSRPASGSATMWVCTAPGTPGTWLACGSAL